MESSLSPRANGLFPYGIEYPGGSEQPSAGQAKLDRQVSLWRILGWFSSRWFPIPFAVRRFVLSLAALMATLSVAEGLRAQAVDEVDLSTPRRAAASFVDAAHRGDWEEARRVLEGKSPATPAGRQRAIELSQKLAYLLSQSISFDLDAVSDTPEGKLEDGVDIEQIATLGLPGAKTHVVLRRLQTSPRRWVFSSGTMARVPDLYAARGPGPFESRLPPALRQQTFGMARWQWLAIVGALIFAGAVGGVLGYVGTRLGARIASRTRVLWDDELVVALRSPSRLFLSVVVFIPLVPAMNLPGTARLVCWRGAMTLGLVAIAWSAIRVVGVISNLVERRALDASVASDAPFRNRGVQTQVRVLRRVVSLVLGACAGAVMLMQFEVVRNVGVSLLASAGVAGIVLGLAAQRTLGSLFAGIQLSITQPIRIGDDVVVENEFGSIEEITLTYVVVKVWDERRLIVPMTRFLEQPFQNWTKVSSELLGTVMLYVDWTFPVDAVRAELDRLITGNALWDGRTKAVHVTDAKESTLEIRILVSAANGGNLFNLRAELRERLVAWVGQLEEGRYLPRARVEGAERMVPERRTS